MCKFCEVAIPSKDFMETHLAGKKHKKLAEGCAPDQCWYWVDQTVAEAEEEERIARAAEEKAAAEAARVAAEALLAEGGDWEVVDSVSKKKELRAKTAAAKRAGQETASTSTSSAGPAKLPVHPRCADCGARARDGATIETDPDDERRGYCIPCWEAYYKGFGSGDDPQPEPPKEFKPWVTKWNRDD